MGVRAGGGPYGVGRLRGKGARSGDRDKRDQEKERRKAQNTVDRLEKQLAELEKEEKELQAVVMKGALPPAELQKGYERLGELAKRIASTMEEWETASALVQSSGEEA